MLFRLREAWHRSHFNRSVRGIVNVPPVQAGEPDGPIVLTQVCHADVFMYLVAIQSLARYVAPQRVVLLDDLSLREHDKALIRERIHGVEIVAADAVPNESCPEGGCWERLLLVADLVQQDYVVQIDADTLTLEDPVEAKRWIAEGVSFTLGTRDGRAIIPMSEAQEFARGRADGENDHIQILAESRFDRLEGWQERRYVRGNAGFAGFAPGSFARDTVEAFSEEMQALTGARWSEWGSEQLTSSYIVANSPRAEVLPFPQYRFHGEEAPPAGTTFLHFIGTHRFYKGRYPDMSRKLVEELGG